MKGKWKSDSSWQLAVGSWQSQTTKVFKTFVVYCLLSILISVGCGEKNPQSAIHNSQSEIYWCPMHPEVQQDHPGKCEKCGGMELILKISDEVLENVLKPVNVSVLASIKTTKPVFKKMNLDFEANGYIDYDSRTKNNISSLVSGRIEKLYIKYQFHQVKKGNKVFEIYSPELVTAQENLVFILNNDSEEKTLIEAGKQKLKLLGFSDGMMEELVKTKKVMRTVPVFSKYDGFVYEMKEMKSTSSAMSSMSSEKKRNFQSNAELSVKEGQYVMMGETVFNVASKNNLSAILQIKSEDISKIHIGQDAEIKIETSGIPMAIGRKWKIDFIEPILQEGKKTMTARIYFDNSKHNYKVGSLVKATIKAEMEFEALWIPLTALVDLGKEKIVWLKKDGNFIAKKVETGARAEGMIEISDGLTEESEIAIEAHYLIDSEGFIKTNEDEK